MKRIATTRQDRFLFKRRLISVAVMSAVSSHAGANPTGPQVVNGQVSVTTQGSVLTVTNTPNAIVNWQGFSIGSNETTRFVQQSAASAVLNRVVGVDPSVILGTLQSNGKVFLVNTNGILFGQGARVDVAGLVASTLNLNDADFLAGRLNFQSGALASGSVVNRGTIATPEGGSVFLVGAAVENSGIIHAPGGEVILAAGQTVRLGSTGAPNVLVEIEAPANRAVNLGEIAVGAGKAGIYGGFVEQKGIVSADTATVNAAGKIVFKATRDTTVAAASVTSANGGKGGLISVESGGTSFIEGVVSATGASGTGGKIRLLGRQVGVIGGAVVDASGVAGGGTVLVGGDYKGGNPDVANARATFLGADTLVRADATGAGDGGRIIVWSDEATRAYGRIGARGGARGGDGGFVETSSAGYLEVTRGPNLTAPLGKAGAWLLDPFNLVVVAGAGLVSNTGAPNFTPSGDNSQIGGALIAAQLASGTDVTLDTTGAGIQAGDITLNAAVNVTGGTGSPTLTLRAHNNVTLTGNAQISSAGTLNVVLTADQDGVNGGDVFLQPGASILTAGGGVSITGTNVSIDAQIGSAAQPQAGAVTIHARNDLDIGRNAFAGIVLSDASLVLTADFDYSGAGNLSIIGGASFVEISVAQVGAAIAPTMELHGHDIVFQDQQSVYVNGGGTQTIAAASDVLMSNSGTGYLMVGSQTLTTLTAGGDFTIESLGDGPAVLSGLDANSGAKNIAVAGDILMRNSAFANSEVQILTASGAGQTIRARSVRMEGAAGAGRAVYILNQSGVQSITTTGNGPTGWGIHALNNGSLDGFGNGVFINSDGSQEITASNGGGILLDGTGGRVDMWTAGSQAVLIDGPGANLLELRGGPGQTALSGGTQTITAGTGTNAGAITILGGSVLNSTAGIYNNAGVQTVSTTGRLRLVAGSGPDDLQANFLCNLHACANLGQTAAGAAQRITAGSIVIQGGGGGARNEANVFSFGPQTVIAPGGITIIGGAGSGPGNWASLAVAGGNPFAQSIDFGVGGLTLRVAPTAGESSTANVYSDGSQTVTGTGDIALVGGRAGARVWSEISAQQAQSVTASSISITAEAGPSSTGIFTANGPQSITTTGGIGGNPANYGLSIRNLGATGTDQNGFGAAAYITGRVGSQTVAVTGSRGILLEGVGGVAVIDGTGTAQSISSTGAIDLKAGVGAALINFGTGSSQQISAGSITLTGGTADGAAAIIEALNGTQDITVGGALTLTGGSAPGPTIPDLANPPAACGPVSSCAVVRARAGLQTIDAGSIAMTGGSAGSENLVTIRGDLGQDISIGSGGLTIEGGAGLGLRNFGMIENYAGDQILTFPAGAPLSLTGGSAPAGDPDVIAGTKGIKHFASIFAAPGSTSQQILGNPVITLTGGPSGGNGNGGGFTYTWRGNNAAIFAETGSQTILAQRIESRGGQGNENNASIDAWQDGAPQTISVIGDIVAVGGGGSFTTADFISHGAQTITARSILLEGAAGGAAGVIWNTVQAQSIATTGAGAHGWGIELANKGAAGNVYIRTDGPQQINATNGGGILLDAVAGAVEMRANGAQSIAIDGATSANALMVRGVAGRAEIHGRSQSIVAGSAGSGSITLQGGTANYAQAFVFTDAGAQNISTTGQLSIVAGSAPDLGQPPLNCGLGGACALIGNVFEGSDPAIPIQTITALGGISIVGGSTGAHNDTGIFSRGSQEIDAPGGITLQAGGGGPNNFATIAMDRAGYSQSVEFGANGLTILANTAGATGNFAEVYSSGTQTISGTGDIRLEGGVTGGRSWAHVTGLQGQDIEARSLSITALAGPVSVYLYNETGVQAIRTTGGVGGDPGAFGLTLRNLGSSGADQGGYPAAAAITSRSGAQSIEVVDSAGLRVLGDQGLAIINNGQLVDGIVDARGISQSITVRGTGANTILVQAGTGQATIDAYSTGAQTVVAGDTGQSGSISVLGGTHSGAVANVVTSGSAQSIRTSGSLALAGGTAARIRPLNFDQEECLAACAAISSEVGSQTIDAGSIALRGGVSGSENFAAITAELGQSITVHGAGGMTLTGGGNAGAPDDHSNFAIIDNYGGAQVVTFSTPGAPLTIDAGDAGLRHFAGLYNGGLSSTGQQILGNPVITVAAGTGGSGGNGPDRFQLSSNFAFVGSESGAQLVNATSILLRGGGTDSNIADLLNWGGERPGSLPGSQSIATVNGLTLEGGTGNDANVRVYSHSGSQAISVGGALTLRRRGAGDVFLGNVFDPAAANIGINAVDLSVAGGLHLQGGNIWGDDGITLHLATGGTATGGAIHAGRASAPTDGGEIVVDPGVFVTLEGSLGLDGSVGIGGSGGILELTGGTLTVANGAGNSGTLRLRNLSAPAALIVSGGQLVNGAGGVVQSLTAGGSAANTITAPVLNQGTIQVDHALTINNVGTTFDITSGNLDAAGGTVLTVDGGIVRIGSGTNFGARPGALDVAGNAVLELASDVTLPAFRQQLGLSGTVHVTGLAPVTLTNHGILDLSFDTLDATVTVVNNGQLTLMQTGGDGTLHNLFDATAEATGSNTLGALTQDGLLRVRGDDVIGIGKLLVDAAATNSGTIELQSSANGTGGVLELGPGATLTNTGTLSSVGLGASVDNQVQAAVVNQGTIDAQRSLTITNTGRVFDTGIGTVVIAQDQTLRVEGGTVRIGSGSGLDSVDGILDVAGTATLELASDVTLAPGPGQLGLSGDVTITAASPVTLTSPGTLDLTGDTLDVPVTLVNQGTLTLRGTYGAGVLDNRLGATAEVIGGNALGGVLQAGTLRIRGTDGFGNAQLGVAAGTLTNSGEIELESSATGSTGTLVIGGGTGQLINTGTLRSCGAGTASINSLQADLVNAGLLDVQQSLDLVGPQPGGNAGVVAIAAGATLGLASNYVSTGTLQGNGTISLPGFTLSNSGIMAPGSSPGTLHIAGNLVLTPASILDIEIEGAAAGEYDVINVTGVATLDGTLNILFPGTYQGAVDDEFRVLAAGTVSGAFATVALPANRRAGVAYGLSDVVLSLEGILNRWVAASGLWTLAANWSLNEVPTASHDVEVGAGSGLVTIPSGSTFDIHSLLLGDSLLIDTSTLNLADDLVIDPGATLQLLNARVGGAGAVQNRGTIQVLPGNGSTLERIAASTGQILVQSNTTTLGEVLVAHGFVNQGTIRLTGGGVNAGLGVSAGTLVNQGTIISEGVSASANRLGATIDNRGVLQVDEDIRIDNVGTTFTQNTGGDLNIAAGQLVFLNGGTLNLQAAMTVDPGATMRLGGVTVNGPAALVNQGILILDSFNTINAALNNQVQGRIDIPIGANQLNGQLTQDGTLNLLASGTGGAFLDVENGFVNTGTIVLHTASTGIQPRLSVAGTLTNNGTIRSEAAGGIGPTEIRAEITNAGTMEVDHSLAIIMNSGRTFDSGSGTLDIAAGAELSVDGGTTRIGTGTLAPSLGTLRLGGTSHMLDLAGDVTLPANGWQLDLTNGLVTVDSTIAGGVTLTNLGTLDIGGDVFTANVALTNQGTLLVPGGTGATVQGALTQAGTIQVLASTAGNAFFTAANGFINTGTIELRAGPVDSVSRLTVTGGTLSNAANATLRSTTTGAIRANELDANVANAGTIDATHSVTLLNNAGRTFDSSGGALTIAAGSAVTVNGGTTRIGTATLGASQGALRLAGISHALDLAGSVTVPASGGWQLDLSNGQVTLDSNVAGGVTLTNLGTLDLAGDRIAANVAVDNRGVLHVPGGSGATVQGVMSNVGTIQVEASAAGDAVLTAPNGFTNVGTVELSAAPAGRTARLELGSGTLTNMAAGVVWSISTAAPGAAPANRIHGGASNAGSIDLAHDLEIFGALTIPGAAAGVVVAGAGNLTVGGAFTVNATGAPITIGGTGALATTAASTLNGGQLHLDTRRWNNSGAMTIGGRVTFDNGAVLTNAAGATVTLTGTNGFPIAQGLGALGVVSNAGTLSKTATAVQTIQTAFSNTGTVNVDSGVLELAAGGTHSGRFGVNAADTELRFGGGTHAFGSPAFSGPGVVRVNGATLAIAEPTIVSNPFVLQAGSVTGAGDLTLNGPFTLSGGTVSGTGVLVTNGATTENNATALLDGRTWSNFGALLVTGRISMDNGATLINQPGASIDLAAGATNSQPLLWDGTGTIPVLRNLGVMAKNSAVAQRVNVALANAGALNVNNTSLTLAAFAAGTNDGSIEIGAGATLSTGGVALVNSPTGTIAGTGTLDLGGATLTNAGTLRPGASPGTLSIVGDLALTASSVVAMEIEGTAPGQFDVIDVSGDATLAGTLNVTLPGAYRGGVNDTFAVISAASTSGVFATIDAPADMTLVPRYGAPAVTLTVTDRAASGVPPDTTTAAIPLQVPSSVIVGVQTAQSGGEGDAILSEEEEEEKEKEQATDETRANEEQKNEKPLQVCM